jgi:hypothetical protein
MRERERKHQGQGEGHGVALSMGAMRTDLIEELFQVVLRVSLA